MRLLCATVWWACALVAAVSAQQDSLFTISIDIGGEQPEELPVRDGDVPSRLAEAFAQKHGLNDRAANTIAQAILKKAEELTRDEKPAAAADGTGARPAANPVLFSLTINIGGTPVPLDVRDGDVPKVLAAAFAQEHKLDAAAQDKITQAIVSKATELREASSGAPVPVAVPNKPAVDAAAAAAAAVGESAPSTAASASGSKDETQRLLFSLDVNLGGAQGKVPLDVHAGAVPADLAQQFATQYGLGSTAVTQLTEAIVNEAKQKVRVRVSSDLGTRWHAQLVASMRSLLQR